MMKRLLLIFCFVFAGLTVTAQDATGQLLARINDLRSSVGQSGYTINSALTAAANNHAAWMVNTGKVSHTQDDGSGPRTRARNAGFSSNFVSENIYMGSSRSIESAWTFWVNSPIHYAGMTSPNYDNIGIGVASGANGYAFVLVFGNASGSLPRSVSTGQNSGGGQGATGAIAPPSFVVGVDGIGNIMHEVQPGDTVGDIALIYGYTWEKVPYMLGINGMTEDDVPYLEIGSVFLVPPQDGTYTPSPAPPTATATMTQSPTIPPRTATEAIVATQMIAPATFVLPTTTPEAAVIVRALPTVTPINDVISSTQEVKTDQDTTPIQTLLIIAVVFQVGIIGVATIEFFKRPR